MAGKEIRRPGRLTGLIRLPLTSGFTAHPRWRQNVQITDTHVNAHVGGLVANEFASLVPESQRRREEEARARGAVIAVTGRDVGLAPMTDEQIRKLASELVIETTIPPLAGLALVMGSVSHHDHAELRTDQIRAACSSSSAIRSTCDRIPRSGTRDAVFSQEQLLLAMRLVIQHGQPGLSGEIDHLRVARLLLGVTEIMVSGKGLEASAAEDVAVALALRRLGLPRVEQTRYEFARCTTFLLPAPAPPSAQLAP